MQELHHQIFIQLRWKCGTRVKEKNDQILVVIWIIHVTLVQGLSWGLSTA